MRFVGRFDPIAFTPGEDPHLDWPDVHVIARPGNPQPPSNGFHIDSRFVERPFEARRPLRRPTSTKPWRASIR